MATDLERLVVSLEANIKSYEREMRRARDQTDGAARAIEKRMQEVGTRIDRIMSTSAAAISTGFQRIGGLAGAYLSIDALKGYADAWTESGNKIRAAGEEGALAGKRQSELADLAIRARSEFGATVDLYAGLMKATEELGKSQADVFQVTETISKGFTIGGKGADAAADAIQQLNQAFQAGKLSGDELNSVLEGAPILARLIAKEFGVSVGALKKLGEDGKLAAGRVFDAILKGSAEIDATFAKTIPTISQSFTNLNTAVTRYVGQVDQGAGASARFAQGINTIAQNIDVVAPIAASLGASLLAFSLGGPIAAGVAGLASAYYLLGESIAPIAGELATIGDYASVVFDSAMADGGQAATLLQAQFAAAADGITAALSSVGVDGGAAFGNLLASVKAILNAMIGGWVYTIETIRSAWTALGPAIVTPIATAMNSVVASVRAALERITAAVNAVITAINSVGAAIGVAAIGTLDIPGADAIRSAFSGVGKAIGEEQGRAAAALTRDYIGEVIDGAAGDLQKIRDEANARAADRAKAAKEAAEALATAEKAAATARAAKTTAPGAGEGDGKSSQGRGGADRLDAYEREVAAIEKRTQAFAREQDALGKSAFEAAKAEASFRLLDAAKQANVPVTDALRQKVDALSTAYAQAKVSLDEAQDKQREFESLSREVGSALSSSFSDAIVEGERLNDVLSRLIKTLASRGIDRIFDEVFSKNGAGFDLLGGIVGAAKGIDLGINPTGRAAGGPVKAGVPYMVGESGREIFVPTSPGRIVPNRSIAQGSVRQGADRPIQISMTVHALDAPSFARSEAQITGALYRAVQRGARGR